jgi:hypothetical protein
MPNKYEREIEEILRNMERTEPRQGLGERIRSFNTPRPRPRPSPRIALDQSELFMVVGICLALIGAAIAFYKQGYPTGVLGVLTGAAAILGFLCIVLGLALGWWARFRGSASAPSWRGNVVDSTIVDLNSKRPGPFSGIVTQFRILRLKLRYRRKHDDP